MAVEISYDSIGITRVVDPSNATVLQFDRAASVAVTGWSTLPEVAAKKQSWETVSATTGAITGSNRVTP